MNLNLIGKRALVCGSTQGIGKAAAIELALLGAAITLMARNEEMLRKTVLELPNPHAQEHEYIVADFNFPDLVKTTIESYPKKSTISILVNNTGGPSGGHIVEASPEAFLSAFNSHLLCSHHLVQALMQGMKEGGYGRIINVISTSVKIPIRGLGVSNTIRGAVASWSKTLSLELAAFGITVNNVLPGTTMTARLDYVMRNTAAKSGKTFEEVKAEMIAQIPLGRISTPEEVGSVVAFLASPAAGYINGTNIPVDGGRTGSM